VIGVVRMLAAAGVGMGSRRLAGLLSLSSRMDVASLTAASNYGSLTVC
jgi:hypothetical protein